MGHRELSIRIEELIGIPRVVVRGSYTRDHNGLLSCILDQLQSNGSSVLVLDLMDLRCAEAEAASGIVLVLKKSRANAGIHVVAPDNLGLLLKRGRLPVCVRLYPSLDEFVSAMPQIAQAS